MLQDKDAKYTIGPLTYSQEWYDLRDFYEKRSPHFVCGASDAGVICGVSKYKTRLQLYMEKRGLVEKNPPTENMEWGTRIEPLILERFREDNPHLEVFTEAYLYISKEYPMIAASPDAYGYDIETRDPFTVDAKCTTSRMYDVENCRKRDCFGEEHDEIPSDYLMQAQQQMLVMDASRCYLPVLFDGNKLRTYWVDKDERLQKAIISSVQEFYRQVVNQEPPEPDFDHDTTLPLVKSMFSVDEGYSVDLADDATTIYEEYADAKEKIGMYTKIKERAMSQLLFAMGDASTAYIPGTGRELHRTEVAEKLWTEADVEQAKKMLGQVKRKGYLRITERKAK